MSESDDEQTIRELQQRWMDAWAADDMSTIEQILAPDYTLTVSSMPDRPVSRAQWIAMCSRYKTEAFEYRDMAVRFIDGVAVVCSIGRAINAHVDGVDRSFPFFLTDVWSKASGRWQVVSRHSSLPESDGASSQELDRAR